MRAHASGHNRADAVLKRADGEVLTRLHSPCHIIASHQEVVRENSRERRYFLEEDNVYCLAFLRDDIRKGAVRRRTHYKRYVQGSVANRHIAQHARSLLILPPRGCPLGSVPPSIISETSSLRRFPISSSGLRKGLSQWKQHASSPTEWRVNLGHYPGVGLLSVASLGGHPATIIL